MTTEKLISWVAVNQDGTEMAFDSVPERSLTDHGKWTSNGNSEEIPAGSIKEVLGHRLKWNDGHRLCLSINFPKMNLTTQPRKFIQPE